jgi:hypothetical protein
LTSEGIMLSRVPLLYQRLVVDSTLAEETSSQFLSDMVNQRIVNETLDLGQWAPDSKALRVHGGIQHGPDMARVPVQHHDLTVTLRS